VGVVHIKDGVTFDSDGYGNKGSLAPGGIRILSAVEQAADSLNFDVIVTSARDGKHSGPDDPHPKGNALDIHCKGLSEEWKTALLDRIMHYLGYRFFGFIEAKGTDNEHIHVQVTKGTVFP
jgi:hypothetical protein